MPPPTFASALAGTNSNHLPTRDGGAEWSRSRTNGATQTFRRSSTATSISSALQQHDSNAPSTPQAPRYVPPHRNGTLTDMRYSRDQLLDLYKAQSGSDGSLRDDPAPLYVGGWQPDYTSGAASGGWGRNEQTRDAQLSPDICWDKDGAMEPLGLVEMDEEERELFSTSVNTPLKPPATNKENQQQNGLPTRKASMSTPGLPPGGSGPLSPTNTRGPGRRRDTSESYPFPSNPISSPAGGFNRDEQRAASPPPSLLRRKTDMTVNKPSDREGEGDEKSSSSPFGSLRRNPTGPLSAGIGAPSSPWSATPQSAGLSPMGSFGNFGLGQQTGSQVEKRPGLSSGRSESRFKNVLNKDSGEESSQRPVERKTSMSSLSRVNENESWRPQQAPDRDAAPFDETEEDLPSGSAALAADTDVSPSHHRQGGGLRGFGTPSRTESRDDFGFGAFGMTSEGGHGFTGGFYQQTPSQNRQVAGGGGPNEPMSPTDTNPYQSPQQHGVDRLMEDEHDASDLQGAHLTGLGGFGGDPSQQFGALGGLGALPNLGRAGGPGDDRSQTSSTGPNRGFPGLGGLGQLGGMPNAPGWPVSSQGGLGTPVRPTAGLSGPFGSGMFATSMGDMQSPGLAGLGSTGGFGGSRMASMFPPAMQDQMNQNDSERDPSAARPGQPHFPGLGDYGRGAESPFVGQNFGDGPEDADGLAGQHGAPGQQLSGQASQSQLDQMPQQPSLQAHGQPQQPPNAASNQPPPPQQRTMVMPDRMRWIYRDPQGQTQGPWSGLEMHDWYKAGFFSPELLVKKVEDPDYEPLAQLIRRIGNSREPFLVPQIGIPHGQPSSHGPNAWAGAGPIPGPAPTGGAQPPFASSFPSFGTTLTAEQQNALERRKQEEQYLMARQKEHLAQAQMAQRMQHHPMGPGAGSHGGLGPAGQLHHQASGQSLHSQPSFGSMTSPSVGGFQPSPIQGPQGHAQGLYDGSFRGTGQAGGLGAVGAGVDTLGHIREEEIPGIMDRLNLGSRGVAGQFGAPGQPFLGQDQMQGPEQLDQQVQQMMQDRTRLQQEQAMHDAQQQHPTDESAERLMQFRQLQGQAPGTNLDARFQHGITKPAAPSSGQVTSAEPSSFGSPESTARENQQHELSLTEQVQKAASAQQSPVPQQPGLPQPFPPAPSQSPLPAPAAQRTGRQSVADQLQVEQREASETPSIDTPSAAVAPWAKEPAEAPKGPSLKEIQEMEARKAAEAEELASAARRAAFQKELDAAQAQASAGAVAPGLPAASNWAATSSSPVTSANTTQAAWAKAAQKSAGPATAKSMAQIQKEEEARKKRAAAAAAAAATVVGAQSPAVANPAGGKSYANLAGKVSSPSPASTGGGAWTTVGAGGKVKTPGAAAAPPARTVSSGVVPLANSATSSARKQPVRAATMAASGSGMANAQDEFRRWAIGELRPDLNKGISAEDFVASLAYLPADPDILTEAVHGVSSTIDSRHFADEFIRRKRLADKGLVDSSPNAKSSGAGAAGSTASQHNTSSSTSQDAALGGGWSEVAKKGSSGGAAHSQRDNDANGNFRVVAPKKKVGKR